MSRVCVFFGTGFEEIEALTVVDLLRRADISVDMVSITNDKAVTGSHGIAVMMDKVFSEVSFDEVEMIVLPGGQPGTRNLEGCDALMEQVDLFAKEKAVAAICAAPTILGHRRILEGKKAICFPGLEGELTGAEVVYEGAVTDGNIITGRGMGCAIPFGLAIVEAFQGKEVAEKLADKIVYQQ